MAAFPLSLPSDAVRSSLLFLRCYLNNNYGHHTVSCIRISGVDVIHRLSEASLPSSALCLSGCMQTVFCCATIAI